MSSASEKKLLDAARAGFRGEAPSARRGSLSWRAHALGGHLAQSGRCLPFDVWRESDRPDSLWVNNMRFRVVVDKTAVSFERTA